MDINTTIGLTAAFCTTASFIPQAVKTIRTRDTSGISASMYTLFTIGTLTWTVYGLMTHNTPVIIANVITSALALVILFYRLRHGK
jgi:MtN3 and saliva related transmembrane protein